MSSLLSSQNSNKDNSNKYNQTLTKHAPAAEKTVAAEVDTEKKTSKDGESELNVSNTISRVLKIRGSGLLTLSR